MLRHAISTWPELFSTTRKQMFRAECICGWRSVISTREQVAASVIAHYDQLDYAYQSR